MTHHTPVFKDTYFECSVCGTTWQPDVTDAESDLVPCVPRPHTSIALGTPTVTYGWATITTETPHDDNTYTIHFDFTDNPIIIEGPAHIVKETRSLLSDETWQTIKGNKLLMGLEDEADDTPSQADDQGA